MKNDEGKLGIGIVGCGRATEVLHLASIKYMKEVEVRALAELEEDRLNRVADRFCIKRRYLKYNDLLNDPSIDIVAVCVPGALHAEIAIAAIDAGKHVFVEKPLSLDLGDADRMVKRAAQTSRCCMIGFNLRSHRLVQEARRIIRSGELGQIEMIRTVWTAGFNYDRQLPAWRYRRADGGGALFEIGTHHIDLWRFLTGSEVKTVYADSRSQLFEDQTSLLSVRMANDVLVTSSFCQRTSDSNDIEVFGYKGRLVFSCYHADSLAVFSTSDLSGGISARLKRIAQMCGKFPSLMKAGLKGGDFMQSYRTQWRSFIDSILRNKPLPCTFEDGRRSLQVVLSAIESVERGQPVDVGEIQTIPMNEQYSQKGAK
jgi:predicted dehydrogenase